MTVGKTAITAIRICREWGSTRSCSMNYHLWCICHVQRYNSSHIVLTFSSYQSGIRNCVTVPFAYQYQIILSANMFSYSLQVTQKIKFPPLRATMALRAGKGIALPNLRPRHWRWGLGSAPTPGRSTPEERPGTHCTGGWVNPRAGLDGCGKTLPYQDSIPGPSSP